MLPDLPKGTELQINKAYHRSISELAQEPLHNLRCGKNSSVRIQPGVWYIEAGTDITIVITKVQPLFIVPPLVRAQASARVASARAALAPSLLSYCERIFHKVPCSSKLL